MTKHEGHPDYKTLGKFSGGPLSTRSEELSCAYARIDQLESILKDCERHFNKHASATWPNGVEVPNEAMVMLSRIHGILA